MKTILIISLFICTFFSCTKDITADSEQNLQKWQLVQMTGQMANSETTGTNMAWQEYYVLRPDGTFTKSRKQNGETTEASGTYSYKDLADGKYLELTYKTDHAIIGNCTSEPIEVLKVATDNSLHGTWLACDGPGLEYKKVE